jgi:hypothetical protein
MLDKVKITVDDNELYLQYGSFPRKKLDPGSNDVNTLAMRELCLHILELRRAIENFHPAYWAGITECNCHSEYPTGGCLKCDCDRLVEAVNGLLRKEGECS